MKNKCRKCVQKIELEFQFERKGESESLQELGIKFNSINNLYFINLNLKLSNFFFLIGKYVKRVPNFWFIWKQLLKLLLPWFKLW